MPKGESEMERIEMQKHIMNEKLQVLGSMVQLQLIEKNYCKIAWSIFQRLSVETSSSSYA